MYSERREKRETSLLPVQDKAPQPNATGLPKCQRDELNQESYQSQCDGIIICHMCHLDRKSRFWLRI